MKKKQTLTKKESNEILQRARDVYGYKNQILVTLEELSELSCILAKHLRYDRHEEGMKKTRDKVVEEVADVSVVMKHIISIFDIKDGELDKMRDKKIKRLQRWLKESTSIQYTVESR